MLPCRNHWVARTQDLWRDIAESGPRSHRGRYSLPSWISIRWRRLGHCRSHSWRYTPVERLGQWPVLSWLRHSRRPICQVFNPLSQKPIFFVYIPTTEFDIWSVVCSEFGMAAFPDLRTIDYWSQGQDNKLRYSQSKLMAQHNKAGSHEKRFSIHMNENFKLTNDFETWVTIWIILTVLKAHFTHCFLFVQPCVPYTDLAVRCPRMGLSGLEKGLERQREGVCKWSMDEI